jgi:tyrosyl-tRNA synthetase
MAGELELLCRGAERVVGTEELERKLAAARAESRPLRVKLGLDPTAPDIHLGHTVVLRKARDFQDLGHEVHIVIGDFTGRIGDPSGRSEARRQLSAEEVAANAATYVRQLHKILDPARTVVRFNSEWLAPMTFAEVLALAARATVARLLERDDFAGRFRQGRPIHLHEFFYALMQGYDSVALRADVELGGSDQTFNLVMAREIQRDYGQEPEVAVITPLLVGTDGVQKMSKSLGNYVGIEEPPEQIVGKLMSLPDGLIRDYLLACTRLPAAEVESMAAAMAAGTLNPRDAKLRLGEAVADLYHGPGAGARAREAFLRVFSRRELPEDLPERRLPPDWGTTAVDLLVRLDLAPSRSEARRLVQQGAVEVDGARIADPALPVAPRDGSVVRAGKRSFCRVRR